MQTIKPPLAQGGLNYTTPIDRVKGNLIGNILEQIGHIEIWVVVGAHEGNHFAQSEFIERSDFIIRHFVYLVFAHADFFGKQSKG